MQTNNHTQELLKKYILNQCTKAEVEEVIAYFQGVTESSQIPSVENVLALLEEKPVLELTDVKRIHDTILKISKKEAAFSIYKQSWFKYTAAASIVLLITAGFWFFQSDNNTEPQYLEPIIVNNQIETGTDKPTLTLETGEEVALEKGTNYQTANASSNGEKIIYEAGKSNKAEIAYNTLTIPRGGQFYIVLSDGTKVWLNSESQIKYPVAFNTGETRQVELIYGEVYFDVSSSSNHNGSNFKVYHKEQEVQVLGTEFNIKAYKDESNIYTTLVEGKVSVETRFIASTNKTVLAPGEQPNLNTTKNKIQINKVDVFRETAWKEGVFSFKKKPLKDVMTVLSRWYDMEVIFENKALEEVTFSGTLYKKQSFEDILTFIINDVNTYEVNNKTLIIK